MLPLGIEPTTLLELEKGVNRDRGCFQCQIVKRKRNELKRIEYQVSVEGLPTTQPK